MPDKQIAWIPGEYLGNREGFAVAQSIYRNAVVALSIYVHGVWDDLTGNGYRNFQAMIDNKKRNQVL